MTSGVDGEPYPDLLMEKGGGGFPYLVFLDSAGRLIAKHQGPRTAAGFAETGKKAAEFVALEKKANGGDRAAKVSVLTMRLEAGSLEQEEAQGMIKELGKLSAEEQKSFDGLMVGTEIQAILKRDKPQDTAGQVAVGKKFAELAKGGRTPTRKDDINIFWGYILAYAAEAKDPMLFERCLEELKKEFGNHPNAKRFFDEKQKELEAMKAAKKPN